MTNKHSTQKLTGVPETLLIPLYARALESRRENPICRDVSAVDMVERIAYDFSKFDAGVATALGIAIRTEIFDELAAEYIARHPDCLVINIAAGLDARFHRLDNGRLEWVDLDLPESIELRRQFFTETARHRFIAANALDPAWLGHIPRATNVLVIIEGLLMYLDEEDVRKLLGLIAERLPGCEILVEVLGLTQARRTDRSDMVSKTQASFRWGIRDASEMGRWHPHMHYLRDISLYDRHQDRWQALPIQWTASFEQLRNTANRIVHMRSTAPHSVPLTAP